jgi:hypothetical protein
MHELLDLDLDLEAFADPETWFTQRDEIKAPLPERLKTRPTLA